MQSYPAGFRLLDNGCREWQQSHIPGPLDGQSHHPLMLGTVAGDPAWRDFTPFGCKIPEGPGVLIIDYKTAIRTELTYLSSVKCPFEFTSIAIVVSTVRSIIRHFLPHYFLLFRSLLLCLFLLRSPWLQSPWICLPLLWPLMPQGPHCH